MQRLGKSLMLPVSIVPIAAILKGIGYWIDPIGWGVHNITAAFLIESGEAIMNHLPLLFAVGISIGMAKNRCFCRDQCHSFLCNLRSYIIG